MHNRIFLVVMLGVFLAYHEVWAQTNELTKIQAIYQNELAKIDANHLGFLMTLQGNYTNRLNTLENVLSGKGNLDGVLVVRQEKTRFVGNKELSETTLVQTPAELKALQQEFIVLASKLDLATKKDTVKLTKAYVVRLEEVQKNLTRNKKIDEALTVKAEIEKIKQSTDFEIPNQSPPGAKTPIAPVAVKQPVSEPVGKSFSNLGFENKFDGWKKIGIGHMIATTVSDQKAHEGKYAYQSCHGESSPTDKEQNDLTNALISAVFILPKTTSTFSAELAGGYNSNLYVGLYSADDDSEICRIRRSVNGDEWKYVSKPLSLRRDMSCYIKIVDNAVGSWGHIAVDDIQFE
jgi:hypothetical protein